MGELTDKQQEFAEAYVAGGGNASEAARIAGYSLQSARQIGGRLARNPAVQRLIREEQKRVIGGRLCSQALGVLESIMLDPASPAGARVDACKTILDRGGLPAIPAVQVVRDAANVSDQFREVSVDELRAILEEGRARLAQLQARREAAGSGAPIDQSTADQRRPAFDSGSLVG